VLRGLHIQNPASQGKLVTAMRGRVLDVAVDVRRGSPTFGKHVAVELSEDNRQLWVPQGFAHGFVMLSDSAGFFYKCHEHCSPENEVVIRWDDPALGIEWGVKEPTVSPRDAAGRRWDEIASLPQYGVN
jgi:dTDP-4-dehydrorhamnose 3,5-epimerase